MNEYPRAAKWLYGVLTSPPISGIATVGEHPIPQGKPYPGITYQLQGSDDLTVVGEARVWAEFQMLVTAVGQTQSTESLRTAADAIDARLHGLHGTYGPAGDAAVISSTRISVFHTDEINDGVPYRRLGGIYSLLVQPI